MIRKILIHLIILVYYPLTFIKELLRHIALVPVVAYLNTRDAYKQMLFNLDDHSRQYLPYFDSAGLRHNIDHLNSINLKELCACSLDQMAKYADEVTVRGCRKGWCANGEEFAHTGQPVNATAIGNLAYTALYHKILEEREAAFNLLEIIIKNQES